MRFIRPKDVKIVDMCKYIDSLDENKELNELEKDKVFLYLYFIIYALSRKQNYFTKEEDCDDFSVYYAENMYERLFDDSPKKHSLQYKNNEKLMKPKSCLNYIKKTILFKIMQ